MSFKFLRAFANHMGGNRRSGGFGGMFSNMLGRPNAQQASPATVEPQRRTVPVPQTSTGPSDPMKKGGAVKKMASGGSASRRADGIATKGKTRGRMV